MEYILKANENKPRTSEEIEGMLKEAAKHYGIFECDGI